MIELGVDVKTIQYIKQKKYSKQLIELSYFSLCLLCLKSFLYLFVSGDFIRFKFLTLLALVNRFFVAKYKLI